MIEGRQGKAAATFLIVQNLVGTLKNLTQIKLMTPEHGVHSICLHHVFVCVYNTQVRYTYI